MLKKPWFISLVCLTLLCAVAIGTISYTNIIHKISNARADCIPIGPGNSNACARCVIYNGQKSPGCGPESKIVGFVDTLNDAAVSGWACDQSYPQIKERIDVYVGGKAVPGGGVPMGSVHTSETRSDAAGQCNGQSAVGYTVPLQCNNQKAGTQPVYVYAISEGADNSKDADGTRELTNSGGSVQIKPCGTAPAGKYGPCANLQPGEDNPGFHSTANAYSVNGTFQSVGSQRVIVDLQGAGDCDGPGSRYVRAEATLWDGSGAVEAFIDQSQNGAIAGTSNTKDPGDFYHSTYSNIWNAAGLTVRACGNFHTGGRNEIHCGDWINVPS